MAGFRYLVLPPEASTNWLFSEEVIFNLIVSNSRMVMDRSDYYRYKRLAHASDVDFFKYFNLTVLYAMGLIRMLNYRWWYRAHDVTNTLSKINNSSLLREPLKFEEDVARAYRAYKEYISLKRPVVDHSKNAGDANRLKQELASADDDLILLAGGKYILPRLRAYVSRIGTKLLAAEAVAIALRAIGWSAEVFDSMEYAHGLILLRQNNIEIQSAFATDMFERHDNLDRIVQLFEHRAIVQESKLLCLPVRMLMGIENKPDSKGDDGGGLVNRLHLELNSPDVLGALPEEIEHCVRERCWPKGEYRRWLAATSTLFGGLEAACPIISALHVSFLCDLMVRFAPARSIDRGYSLTAQLVARAGQLYARDDWRRGVIQKWIKWFGEVFGRQPLYDTAWGESQRDMKEWTNPLFYVPWWEGGAIWGADRLYFPDVWELHVRGKWRKRTRSDGRVGKVRNPRSRQR